MSEATHARSRRDAGMTHAELLIANPLYRRMCARLSVGQSLDDPAAADELRQAV